jgi:uncharacterized membrane protein
METLFNCSLWGDEAFSAVLAQKGFISMLHVVARDTSPPLFYIIMFIWFKIFGSSEIAIRSLSFLFYLGTVWVIYLIGRELFSKKEAAWAAALTFFNPFLFPYAFEGRMYFTLLFFVSLSYYFFIKKHKLGHILSSAAALYSHHFAIFAIFTQFAYASIELLVQKKSTKRKRFWNLIKHYSLIGILYIPWLYPFYLQTKLVAGGFWLGKPQLKAISDTFFNFIRGDQTVFSIQKKLPALALFLLAVRKWQKKTRKEDLLLIAWMATPVLVTWLISQTKLSIFYERYLLYSVPPLMLLLASATRKIALPIKGAILAIFVLVCFQLFTHPYKKPFKKLANFAQAYLNTKDYFLISYNGKAHHLWESKYYGLNAPLYVPSGQLPFYVGTAQMTPSDIIQKLPVDKTVVAITSDNPQEVKIDGWKLEKSENFDSSLYLVFFKKTE